MRQILRDFDTCHWQELPSPSLPTDSDRPEADCSRDATGLSLVVKWAMTGTRAVGNLFLDPEDLRADKAQGHGQKRERRL
jgi:hypothetical protein